MTQLWRDKLATFAPTFAGKISLDISSRALFATDASPYREIPVGVVQVYTREQLHEIVQFAVTHHIPLIPRGAGTSLGGQVVGSGLVIDTSHLKQIINLNNQDGWVEVEPGVVLDELNLFLASKSLFFGPETSTSNRCTIGGMVGNNSCGAHSLVYGSTRDQLLEVTGYLSDGSTATFRALTVSEVAGKLRDQSLEGAIYRGLDDLLQSEVTREKIIENFPHPLIHRRNGGYALDAIAKSGLYVLGADEFNLSKLIAGSEGTLMVISSVRLKLHPLPPNRVALLVLHCSSLEEALLANVFVQKFNPRAVELMDKTILDLTKDNAEQLRNRSFIEGDPAALLIIELAFDSVERLKDQLDTMIKALQTNNFGYHLLPLFGGDISKVWSLRKAGLGVLSNMKGDSKPVSVIEDCAVKVEDLPAFCKDISSMLAAYDKSCVFHGHAGSGELHLRPILNLKDKRDVELFRAIARETALIVKRYNGSLSGEHGDGRVRGEFLELMVGSEVYALLKDVKRLFDPLNLFNPNKIVETPAMNSSLRFELTDRRRSLWRQHTPFYSDDLLSDAERCNGSADCLKSAQFKGAMCPSFQATQNEFYSPRGRANLIREFLTLREDGECVDIERVVDSLRLCLSCKACKSECPSNVDIAQLKGEILAFYYNKHRRSIRSYFFSHIGIISQYFSFTPRFTNTITQSRVFKQLADSLFGISKKRSLPQLSRETFKVISSKMLDKRVVDKSPKGRILLLNDEFTNYYNSSVGVSALTLFRALGYEVTVFTYKESERTYLSSGDLLKAKKVLRANLEALEPLLKRVDAVVGLEPSVLMTYRDEALKLSDFDQKSIAERLSKVAFTFEEFVASQIDLGLITSDSFTQEPRTLHFHGHCYQKALERSGVIAKILSLPLNYRVEEINSGCCGMGGGFGYEKEHFEVSKQIAELVLLPQLRKIDQGEVVTSGFSCKHQIADLSGKMVKHPAEILFEALLVS